MIKLSCAVIVEGKYDKITLENIIDAPIIATNGFGIFKDEGKRRLIKRLAEEKGIIIMTDSDSAGNLIRSHLKGITDKANIVNVYVPQIKGKEHRKSAPSKEGFLGVEGMSEEIIRNALKKSGITGESAVIKTKKITKNDMFRFGLSGRGNATLKRKELLRYLDLPDNLTPSAMLDVINTFYSYEEFEKELTVWQNALDKR